MVLESRKRNERTYRKCVPLWAATGRKDVLSELLATWAEPPPPMTQGEAAPVSKPPLVTSSMAVAAETAERRGRKIFFCILICVEVIENEASRVVREP